MGVFTYTDERTSPIPPSRLFKALILDSNNLNPKLMPTVVKSIQFIEGDGGVGSIRQITFQEDQNLKNVKNRIDAIDPEKFLLTYTHLEGGMPSERVAKIVYEAEFVPSPDGGSINKMKSTYHTKGDLELTEEVIKTDKEKALTMYKVVEGYLLQNPDAYA